MEDETMNADDFYEEFKNALDFLGLQGGHKELALVSIKGESIVFSYGTKSARICIGCRYGCRAEPAQLMARGYQGVLGIPFKGLQRVSVGITGAICSRYCRRMGRQSL